VPSVGKGLDLPPRDRVYRRLVGKDGLLIGEVARRSGATRKALRLYEVAGILPTARRTESGYRVYGIDALAVLSFVRKAHGSASPSARSRTSSPSSGRAARRAPTFATSCAARPPTSTASLPT